MVIVDIHTHTWIDKDSGTSARDNEAMASLYRHCLWHTQQVQRLDTGEVVEGPVARTIFGTTDVPSTVLDALPDVNFRTAGYGRVAWTVEGIDYYIQWMPPGLEPMSPSPELMLTHMNYVGVDVGVLHCGPGNRDNAPHLLETAERYPDRFIATFEPEEWRAYADDQIEALQDAVAAGFGAMMFDGVEEFSRIGYRENYDSEKYRPFWEEVQRLGIPVMWEIRPKDRFTPDDYTEQITVFKNHCARWPEIPMVLTHAWNMEWFENDRLSQVMIETAKLPNVYIEILLAILNGRRWEYPYPKAQEVVKQLYHEVGPDRLMWGSDMPAVERYCTYRQSLDYIRLHCDFITPGDMDKILGDNAVRLFKIGQQRPADALVTARY
jgi:predicted TIM-barrel fold metal-dependent hydrolase